MLQLRPTNGDSRFYAPNRDLAYCFPFLVRTALEGITDEAWKAEPWWSEYLDFHNVTMDDVTEAAGAMARAFKLFTDKECTSPAEALANSGFFDTKPQAQLAIAAKIGQAAVGAFYVSIRDTLRDEEDPPASVKTISEMGNKFAGLLVKHKAE